MPKKIDIKWTIPYETLINKNGLKTCLEIVPNTGRYLTHNKTYGHKETVYGKS